MAIAAGLDGSSGAKTLSFASPLPPRVDYRVHGRPEDPRRPHETTPLIAGVNTLPSSTTEGSQRERNGAPRSEAHLEPATTAEVALERDLAGRAGRDESGSIERRQGGHRQKRRERPGVRRNDGGGEEPGSGAGTGC